ncbi:MAG TPA: hypothetical protein VD866_28640 [Urbifossiella sp.]|nr:hypothetical protein [Urbifossiella sp.]
MLRARAYYAVIAAGVVLGAAAAGVAAGIHGDVEPDGRRVLGDGLVVPVAVMVGGTFGGLAGVAVAVALDRKR